MKKILVAACLLSSTVAMADGFVCTSQSGLNVKVYNHVDSAEGTRKASVMVISDSSIQVGNKTIARFTDVSGTLTSSGTNYEANVDLRFKNSSRKGEAISTTKLGYVDRVYLNIGHNYLMPVAHGKTTKAYLQIAKRDGSVIEELANCTRYLKN